jgi:hypothetical protein
MTYEERMDRMMEYGEVEDAADYRAIQRLARQGERDELRSIAAQENLGCNGVTRKPPQDMPLNPPSDPSED